MKTYRCYSSHHPVKHREISLRSNVYKFKKVFHFRLKFLKMFRRSQNEIFKFKETFCKQKKFQVSIAIAAASKRNLSRKELVLFRIEYFCSLKPRTFPSKSSFEWTQWSERHNNNDLFSLSFLLLAQFNAVINALLSVISFNAQL